MNTHTNNTVPSDARFARLEDPVGDFPFYNGSPCSISVGQWLFVLAGVVGGFLALTLPIHWPGGVFGQFIPALLMPGIPVLALRHVAPNAWKVIFANVGWREVRLMLGFALLNIVVSMSIGAIMSAVITVTPNGTAAQLVNLDTVGQIVFFAKTIPQLFGEEVITLLPFLAVMQLFTRGFGIVRKNALLAAWVITALAFGLIHLPTYDWNLMQCIVVIGSARLVLTLPWILTKNIWVSTGAHIVNDWILFLFGLLGASLVGKV